MIIGIPRETTPGENRVAATPDTVKRLQKLGYGVHIQSGAGVDARFFDDAYEDVGATVVDDAAEVWAQSDIVIKIHPPGPLPDGDGHELDHLKDGGVLISLIDPANNEDLLERLESKNATAFGLDCVPRLSRAQSVDVLSSMAAIAGYRAVIEAAGRFDRFLSPQMTAAGSTPPAEVMIIGAGVAGLSAIATAKGLGAQVKAFDVRPAVKEEVESLGGRFLELEFDEEGAEGEGGYANVMSEEFIEAEMALFREEIPQTDVLITTASIPGKPAPKLVLEDMVDAMKPGSVIVDLAAASGGNCELTEAGEVVEHHGVSILGETNLASHLPSHASEYFGRNIANLVHMFGNAAEFEIDEDDAVVRGMLVMREGELKWPPPTIEPSPAPPDEETTAASDKSRETMESRRDEVEHNRGVVTTVAVVLAALLMGVVGLYAPPDFVQHFTVFVLACFVGWQVVWNVTPSLHTPLMSVTNAISGIIIVGGILQVTTEAADLVLWLSAGAILVAGINIFGGFLVTQRMLKMFRAEAEGD
jgi:NAD(P) transhydrogenase subunit alpha